METQLFENISQPTLRVGNGKEKQYLMIVSGLLHLGVIILVAFLININLSTDISKPVVVFSSLTYFEHVKPTPLPPLKRKNETKKTIEQDFSGAPIEVPNEIKPEPPQNEIMPSDDLGEVDGVNGGVSDGVSSGIPGVVPGGVVEQPYNSPQPPRGPIIIKSNISLPKRVKYVHPTYPPNAIKARIEGTVIIEAVIGRDGKIESAKITKSVPFLGLAALEAVKKWEFSPMIVSGETKEFVLTVTINFKLT